MNYRLLKITNQLNAAKQELTLEEDIPFLKKETDKILNNSQQEKFL